MAISPVNQGGTFQQVVARSKGQTEPSVDFKNAPVQKRLSLSGFEKRMNMNFNDVTSSVDYSTAASQRAGSGNFIDVKA
tara:strand:- start:519 stop:755 length:237 start_codon:yes stop_codon:yes gene_type:complete